MLRRKNAVATLAVSDLRMARDVYEKTLGLESFQEVRESVPYKSGNSVLLVYSSEYAGTSQATAATWAVGDDADAIVEDPRRARGGLRGTRRAGERAVYGSEDRSEAALATPA